MRRRVELLERRFGDEIRTTFDIEPTTLTREEAQYLIGFHKAAKGGDPAAAAQLIGDLAAPLFEQIKRFGAEVIFVAPHAIEASGENAIPQMLAGYLAQKTDARDDINIVQRNKRLSF